MSVTAENNVISGPGFSVPSPEVSWRTYMTCSGTSSGYPFAYFFGNKQICASSKNTVFPIFGVHCVDIKVTVSPGKKKTLSFVMDDTTNGFVFNLTAEQREALDMRGLTNFILANRTVEYAWNNSGSPLYPVAHPSGIYSKPPLRGKTTHYHSNFIGMLSRGALSDPKDHHVFDKPGQAIWAIKNDVPTPKAPVPCH
jgi:hypothetical protein